MQQWVSIRIVELLVRIFRLGDHQGRASVDLVQFCKAVISNAKISLESSIREFQLRKLTFAPFEISGVSPFPQP